MEKFLTPEFWSDLLKIFGRWVFTELPGIILLVIIFFVVLKLIGYGMKKLRKILIHRAEHDDSSDVTEATKRINTLVGIINGIVRISLVTVFIIMLLSKFSINVAPILASAGILGLAVGFGAQELVRDYITGFFILLENQVRIGDVAIINETGGLVEKIEMRTITLRDLSGVIHITQNGKISTLSNMTKDWSAMVFEIGVAYKENLDEVMETMMQVAEELQQDSKFGPNIIEPMEMMGLEKFGDSALVVKARIKTKPIQQWSVGREYRKRLKVAFDNKNIEIPFPHSTIYWGEEIDPLKLEVKTNTEKSNEPRRNP